MTELLDDPRLDMLLRQRFGWRGVGASKLADPAAAALFGAPAAGAPAASS